MASGYGVNGGTCFKVLVRLATAAIRSVAWVSLRGINISANRSRDISGPGRCFAFWQELLGCYVVNGSEGEAGKKKCGPALEDYYECLHHNKEVCRAMPLSRLELPRMSIDHVPVLDADESCLPQALRAQRIQAAYRKAEAVFPRENAPKAEQIRNLGLLGKEEDTAKVLGS